MAVTGDRFDELLGLLFDGELPPAGCDELVAVLRADPRRRRELRQDLVLWELWSQQHAPERSAEAFLAGCRTRLRAERQGESFLTHLKERISRDAGATRAPSRSVQVALAEFWQALRPPAALAWAAAVGLVAVVSIVWMLAPPRAEAVVSVHGEVVCTACILHETHDHLAAIRVHEGGATRVYYVGSDQKEMQRLGNFCAAPIPLTATGKTENRGGRLVIEVQTAATDPRPAPPPPKPEERVLFPF
jgi:hypothetical protein